VSTLSSSAARIGDYEIVAVGAPLAALQTVALFLIGLPERFPLPVVVLLRGRGEEGDGASTTLQAHCVLPVRLIDDKEPIVAGRVHLAPADYHLFVEKTHFSLSMDAPVDGARPSIDVLFESVADAYGEKAVCVLLEGSGDGESGAAKIRARGGLVIVQNPATAATGPMAPALVPQASVTETLAAKMLHLSEIAPFVSRLCEMGPT
jgi:two-component system, chemotaxis family, protein-glutamate methylesterase/glutaminase